jgi:hypothetical protein
VAATEGLPSVDLVVDAVFPAGTGQTGGPTCATQTTLVSAITSTNRNNRRIAALQRSFPENLPRKSKTINYDPSANTFYDGT